MILGKKAVVLTILQFFVFVLIAPLSFAGCSQSGDEQQDDEQLMTVEVVTPIRQPVVERVSLTGTIRAEHSSLVAANMGGKVKTVYADVGDHVKKGQLLMKLETSALDSQYRQAKAQLEMAKLQLAVAEKGARVEEIDQLHEQEAASKTAYETAEDNYERQKKLFEDGVISESMLDQALTARDSAKAAYESLKLSLKIAQTGARPEDVEILRQSVAGAEGQVNAMSATIGYASVKAPFDGVINKRNFEVGEFAGTGKAIFEIIGEGRRKIVVDVPATLITQVSKADDIIVRLAGETRSGAIYKVHPAISEMTRTGVVEVVVDDESDLIVGGFVEIEFSTTIAADVLTLPVRCVLSPDNEPYVWAANDGGTVSKMPVVLGAASRQVFEIKDGLSGSERVLIVGQNLVSANARYEVREYRGDSAIGGKEDA